MVRFYDAVSGAVTELIPARRGQLRICACGPAATGPATTGPATTGPGSFSDLRDALLTDVIRRNAERHGWSVLSCRAARPDNPATGWAVQNIAPADFAPGPHESAQLAVTMISGLIATGHAQPVPGGSVRFDAGEGWLLWEAGPDGEGWPSPWGHGRPSPSIECSAVALSCLGDRIDVRVWPPGRPSAERDHQDAETSAAAGRGLPWHWLQSGNVAFAARPSPDGAADGAGVPDLAARGLDPLAARLALLQVRYRDPVELSWQALSTASDSVRRWQHQVADWADEPSRPISADYWARFTAALDDDLDTPAALGALAELADDPGVPPGARFETFAAADRVLALDLVSLVGRPR